MRLIFIRHADPDYENDTITKKGMLEAKCLADYIEKLGIDEAYESPLKRAQKTAEYSLKKLGIKATTCDWLMEFPAEFDPNISSSANEAYRTELKKNPDGTYRKRIVWDVLPSYYSHHPELFDRDGWKCSEIVRCSNTIEVYEKAKHGFLELLNEHGYIKDGDIFKAEHNNDKTVAFFCHLGITSVLLSILWNISPFIPLQYMAIAPTSVTELITEEREKGFAIFRAIRIGDLTHLNIAGEEPSCSGRFCERYENENERH